MGGHLRTMSHWRKAREQKHMELLEISTRTRIPIHYIEMIDNGEFSRLPQGTLGRNYIRSYARVIGIDPNPMLCLFQSLSQSKEVEPEQESDSHEPSSRENKDKELSSSSVLPKRGNKEKLTQHQSLTKRFNTQRLKQIQIKKVPMYAWISLAVVVIAIPVCFWWFFANKPSEVSSNTPTSNSAGVLTPNPNRPVIELQPSNGPAALEDVYLVKNVDELKVSVTTVGTGSSTLKVYKGTSTGSLLLDTKTQAGKVEEFSDSDGLYLRIGSPDQIILKVNDITIDTSNQKKSQSIQLKIGQ